MCVCVCERERERERERARERERERKRERVRERHRAVLEEGRNEVEGLEAQEVEQPRLHLQQRLFSV